MANTSELARELLERCLRGDPCPAPLIRELAEAPDGALFSIVAEGLSDRFDPVLVDCYARVFSLALAHAGPGWTADQLYERYTRVRLPRPLPPAGQVRDVYVLSRVTLGADVAITSVVLDAAKQRFPKARIWLAGGRKNWELFAADPWIGHHLISYSRSGGLRDRIHAVLGASERFRAPGALVIDPDSRLTQLGLLPVCPEERYFFFESRACGGDGEAGLGELARRWVEETFGVRDARAYIAPRASVPFEPPYIAVSLGVGDNPAKRLGDWFEEELLKGLAASGARLLVDTGAGGDERERVTSAVARARIPGDRVRLWSGSFAEFAGAIARASAYVGYDSAGQHVAAACGVPLVSVFAGFASDRMFHRWRPSGPGWIEVIRVEGGHPRDALARTLAAVQSFVES